MPFQRPSWDESFMLHAILASLRSSCLKRRCGAALVKDKRVIASGYNGAPPGIATCLNEGFCFYENLAQQDSVNGNGQMQVLREQYKIFCKVIHAEKNSFNQCSLHGVSAADSELFSTNMPCPRCVIDEIIPNKVKRVVVWKEYLRNIILTADEYKLSKNFLEEAKIELVTLDLSPSRIKEMSVEMLISGDRLTYKFNPNQ